MPEPADETAFFRWLRAHGVSTSKVAWPVTFPRSGRGVAATRAIRTGEEVLRIPESLMFSSDRCAAQLQPWIGRQLPHLVEESGFDELVIALAVLCQLGRGRGQDWRTPVPDWGPYVRCLPPHGTYDGLPSEWSPPQVALLGDGEAAECAADRSRYLEAQFTRVVAAARRGVAHPEEAPIASSILRALRLWPPDEGTTDRHAQGSEGRSANSADPPLHGTMEVFNDFEGTDGSASAPRAVFRWAVHTVQSRVFLCGLEDSNPAFLPPHRDSTGRLSLVMVPLGDMFNHYAEDDGPCADDEGRGGGGGSAAAASCGRRRSSHAGEAPPQQQRAGGCTSAAPTGAHLRPVVLDAEWVCGEGADTVAPSKTSSSDSDSSGLAIATHPARHHVQQDGTPGGFTDGQQSTRERGFYVLRAPVDVVPGQELAISYGERTGRDLLESYGFLLPLEQNVHEGVSLSLDRLGVLPPPVRNEEVLASTAHGDLVSEGGGDSSAAPGAAAMGCDPYASPDERDNLPPGVQRQRFAGEGDPMTLEGSCATRADSAGAGNVCLISSRLLLARRRAYEALGAPLTIELTMPPPSPSSAQPTSLAVRGEAESVSCPDTVGVGRAIARVTGPGETPGVHSFLPCAIGPATPHPDTLAVLRALVLHEDDASVLAPGTPPSAHTALPSAGSWRHSAPAPSSVLPAAEQLLRVRPERLAKAVSRGNELAALSLLHWLLHRAAGELLGWHAHSLTSTPGPSEPPAPFDSSLETATALARSLLRCLQRDALALALASAHQLLPRSSSSLPGSAAVPLPVADGPGIASSASPAPLPASPSAAALRLHVALQYRVNRASVLLCHALYVTRMHGVAAGDPGAGEAMVLEVRAALRGASEGTTALLCPPLHEAAGTTGALGSQPGATAHTLVNAASSESGGPVAYGLELQSPWAEMLLDGRKTIETRGYPMPQELSPSWCTGLTPRLALIRSPPGGLSRHGLWSGEVVGWARFTAPSIRYTSQQQWDADEGAHCVPKGHPLFGWASDAGADAAAGERFGWAVAPGSVSSLPVPVPVRLSESQRVVRSVFRLCPVPEE